MAKLPGLFMRDGSFHLRVVIPKDLRAAYGGKVRDSKSLSTANPREANLKGTARRAELLAEFDRRRKQLNPQPLNEVTPEMSAQLAQRVRARILKMDEHIRLSPSLLEEVLYVGNAPLRELQIGGPDAIPPKRKSKANELDGLSRSQVDALADHHAHQNADAAINLAARRLRAMLPFVKAEAHALGFAFSETVPGAKEALQAALSAYRQAWHEVTERDAGHVVETPTIADAHKADLMPMRLRDVFKRWKESKVRSADSVAATERALKLFEGHTGNPPLDQLKRAHGDAFRAALLKLGAAPKTSHDRLTYIKSLLNYASRDLEAIPRNPWEGLDIEAATSENRRPWTNDEVRALLAQPLYTQHELPTAWNAGKEAAYWLPLLGLYTGARVSELAQLRIADVDITAEIPSLLITDEGVDQHVKSKASVRRVPIHSEVLRLGFREYVERTKKTGAERLWPDLKLAKPKAGAYFSNWFGTYRKDKGFPDFHSLRHTVRSRLANAGVPAEVSDVITGHRPAGSVGNRVYTHWDGRTLQRAIETVVYD